VRPIKRVRERVGDALVINVCVVERSAVSAVLLTIGEPTADQALASIARQTRPVDAQIVVAHVTPFSAAFERGVAQVGTPWFLQVDADVVLFASCVERLLAIADDDTAIACGFLDDPLQGPVRGVKLFRTELCRRFPLEDDSNCETRQVGRFQEAGYRVRSLGEDGCVGTHRTDLSDEVYTFERFRLLGTKLRDRDDPVDFCDRLRRLGTSRHRERALGAAVGFVAGLFGEHARDGLAPFTRSPEYLRWTGLPRAVTQPMARAFDRGALRDLVELVAAELIDPARRALPCAFVDRCSRRDRR
jgi:hypothetical protein